MTGGQAYPSIDHHPPVPLHQPLLKCGIDRPCAQQGHIQRPPPAHGRPRRSRKRGLHREKCEEKMPLGLVGPAGRPIMTMAQQHSMGVVGAGQKQLGCMEGGGVGGRD